MKLTYRHTIRACLTGYIVQAVIVNFAPLLFLTFQASYGIPLTQITMLVTVNFGVQLLVDLLSAGFVDKIGYRVSIGIAHLTAAAGLIMLAVLPDVLPTPFYGLLAAVVVYAVGGGLLEVLVSPIVESCPTDNKAGTMSLLHSFYSWGQVGVVLLSTVYFAVFGTARWKILGLSLRELFSRRIFWLFFLMMLCAGASEQAVSQWASTFAEQSLGVSKTVGDLAGPMAFAVCMGVARSFYGKYGEKVDLDGFMIGSAALCVLSYLLLSLVPVPALGLVGCALCGVSVGIMWPGTLSKAAATLRGGGTAMFALLALAGDLGCSGGPTLAGMVSAAAGDELRAGLLAAVVFPLVLLLGLLLLWRKKRASAAARE